MPHGEHCATSQYKLFTSVLFCTQIHKFEWNFFPSLFLLETWWWRPGWPFSTEIKCDSVITWNLIILTACVLQGHFSPFLAFLAVKPRWDWVTCRRLAQVRVLSFSFRPFFCFNDSPLRRSSINTACRGLGTAPWDKSLYCWRSSRWSKAKQISKTLIK